MYSRIVIYMILLVAVVFISCSKEDNNENDQFYGRWKTSYGDTITFSRSNKKDVVDFSSFASLGSTDSSEFNFKKGKLWLRELDGPANSGFRKLESFTWKQRGREFTIVSTEWFAFMSALSTFTFTKIP